MVQKVAAAVQAIKAQKAAVDGAAAELDELQKANAAGATNRAEVRTAEQKLIDAKAKLASLEAELPYLLGKEPSNTDVWLRGRLDRLDVSRPPEGVNSEMLRRYYLDLTGRLPTPDELAAAEKKAAPQGPVADRIRAALDQPFTYDGKDIVVSEVIKKISEAFQEATQGLVIKDAAHDVTETNGVNLHFDHMPLGAALEWVEDTRLSCRFYVRDYGLVFAPRDQAPPGAPLLHDFWKGTNDEQPATTSGPPAVRFVAKVMSFNNAGDRRVTIHLRPYPGASLAPGDILEVYRIKKENRQQDQYVGSIRVRIVNPDFAIASPLDNTVVQGGEFAGVKIDGDGKDTPGKVNPNPAVPPAEGLVKKVLLKGDGSPGEVLVTLGLGDGVAKGDILTVVRIRQEAEVPLALPVGKLRVVQVGEGESRTEPVGDFKTPIREGDKVRREPRDKPAERPDVKGQSFKPPTRTVEGLVKEVSPAGRVRINLGSDYFLAKGNTLEVYRPNTKSPNLSKYLGRIRVVETASKEAFAEPVGELFEPLQEGDYISGHIAVN